MRKGKMWLQRAEDVLHLHHAPRGSQGHREAIPHPTFPPWLGCSLTHLEASPVQEQQTGFCPAPPWIGSCSALCPCPTSPIPPHIQL